MGPLVHLARGILPAYVADYLGKILIGWGSMDQFVGRGKNNPIN